MNTPPKRRNPSENRGHEGYSGQVWQRNPIGPSAACVPMQWRDRLPDPGEYYRRHVAKLGRANGGGWAQGRCPFHDDASASLSVHLVGAGGGWRCFAGCGSGDLVSFHMRRTGLLFKDAVRDLVRGDA